MFILECSGAVYRMLSFRANVEWFLTSNLILIIPVYALPVGERGLLKTKNGHNNIWAAGVEEICRHNL